VNCLPTVSQYRFLRGKCQEVRFAPGNKGHYLLVKQLPAIAGVSSAQFSASSCKPKSGTGLPQRELTAGKSALPSTHESKPF